MKHKVTLINPPSPFLDDQKVFPYLGILNVATGVQRAGHDVQVIDLPKKGWLRTIDRLGPADVFGVTATSAQFQYAHTIGQMLKGKGITVIGGTHVNNLPEDDGVNTEDLKVFDVVYKGDGENFLDEKGHIGGGALVRNLDDVPIPDRNFFDLDSYHSTIDGRKATTILTQRGCPFTCVFCSGRDNPMYKKSRQHSAERVVAEMDALNEEYGFDAFMWFDDEVNIHPSRLGEIADRLKDKDYIHRGFLRSDLLVKHPESLEYLAQMGFKELCIGVESGSNRVLDAIGKNTTREQNLEAAAMIKGAGFRLKTFTMVGHPGETYDEAMETASFIKEAQPDGFDIAMMQPYPGSILYRDGQPSDKFEGFGFEYNGLFFNKPRYSEESPFHKGIKGTYNCHVRTEALSSDDIVGLRETLEDTLK